jgi:hypothetical protein
VKKVVVGSVVFLVVSAFLGFLVRTIGTSGTAGSSSTVAETGPSHLARSGSGGARSGQEPDAPAALGPLNQAESSVAGLDSSLPGLPARVVKTARISVQAKRGGFGAAFQDATLVAARFGGYVESSSSEGRAGSLLIRIPADRFEQALGDLEAIGPVKYREISGQDVSAQFVDLGARLRTWRAQETVLLRLMGSATSITDTLRVQNELQQVQLRMEQIEGQLRVLRGQTAYATIAVGIREVGAPIVQPVTARTPSLVRAWRQAWAGFLGVVSAVIVGLGYLLPVSLLGLAAWLGYRRAVRPRAVPAS